MAGISVVESLAQLQEYLWTLQNQRIDALRLLTNVITLIRSDVDDPDAFEFFPGAQWIVEDPGQVGQLEIDPTAAQITLEAESLIKGDLQNMLGGLPFAGGCRVHRPGGGRHTATGMSIITSVAQKMIQARKQQYAWAWGQIGELFLGMMGQMIREERTISQVGPGGMQQLLRGAPARPPGPVQRHRLGDGRVHRPPGAADGGDGADEHGRDVRAADGPEHEAVHGEGAGVLRDRQHRAVLPAARAGPRCRPPRRRHAPGRGRDAAASPHHRMPVGSQGQTNPALAAAMGQGGADGLSMAPDQFAQQQMQAVQQMGHGRSGLVSAWWPYHARRRTSLNRRASALAALAKHPSWPELEAEIGRKIERLRKTAAGGRALRRGSRPAQARPDPGHDRGAELGGWRAEAGRAHAGEVSPRARIGGR